MKFHPITNRTGITLFGSLVIGDLKMKETISSGSVVCGVRPLPVVAGFRATGMNSRTKSISGSQVFGRLLNDDEWIIAGLLQNLWKQGLLLPLQTIITSGVLAFGFTGVTVTAGVRGTGSGIVRTMYTLLRIGSGLPVVISLWMDIGIIKWQTEVSSSPPLSYMLRSFDIDLELLLMWEGFICIGSSDLAIAIITLGISMMHAITVSSVFFLITTST